MMYNHVRSQAYLGILAHIIQRSGNDYFYFLDFNLIFFKRIMDNKQVAILKTPLGFAAVGFSDGVIARLWLPEHDRQSLENRVRLWAPRARRVKNRDVENRIRGYFAKEQITFTDRVDLGCANDFAKRVYETLRKTRRGQTITYGAVASLAGRSGAARAVGHAVGRNPIPLIIPCHRVVRSDGSLGGFSAPGGVALKKKMLELESDG